MTEEDKQLVAEIGKVHARLGEDMVLTQIGANDGVQADPLFRFLTTHKCQAHLLEPAPRYFKELTHNYHKFPHVTCHRCGIAEKSGTKTMTVVDYNNQMPSCFKGLSTFDESKNLFSGRGWRHLSATVEQMGMTEEYELLMKHKATLDVSVLTLDDFFSANGISQLDVFVTDCEGYDWIVFDQLDLERYSPAVIFMETHTLGREVWQLMGDKLTRHGYKILTDLVRHPQINTLAVKHD